MLQSLHGFMTQFPGGDVAWIVLMFVVVLSILVFIHEMGHFLAARSVGVKVETFSIGFGKEIFGWNDKKGCRWKVAMIPLGGYVKMFGEDPSEKLPAKQEKESFAHKNVWARIWVVFAGPLANFVFAFVALSMLFLGGEQKLLPQVGEVMENTPAQAAGLVENDLILKVNDVEITDWMHLVEQVSTQADIATTLLVEREGNAFPMTITPASADGKNIFGEDVKVGRVGIKPAMTTYHVEHTAIEAVGLGFVKTGEVSWNILKSVWKMIKRDIPSDQIGGPIAIAEMAGSSAEQGSYQLIMFMVLISVNLGLINLFPIPMLDGGHLVYYFAEVVKGSPLGDQAHVIGQRIGLFMLLSLMTFAFYNDLARIVTRTFGAE